MAAKTEEKESQRRLKAFEATKRKGQPRGSVTEAAHALKNITPGALSKWLLQRNVSAGTASAFTKADCIEALKEAQRKLGRLPTRDEMNRSPVGSGWRTHWTNYTLFLKDANLPGAAEKPGVDREIMLRVLRGAPTLDEIGQRLGISRGQALDYCDQLKTAGYNVFQRGDRYSLEATPAQLPYDEKRHLFKSDDKGKYRFGFVTDNHLGSKYAREDVLHSLYDWFAAEGITRVYNAGNWIDGEAKFNRHDLLVHGQDQQLEYFAKRYPQRDGMETHFIAGDDHEGWYAKDGGVDIGMRAEQTAKKLGRSDLKYLGYMEAYITLQHLKTKATSQMLVVHPGGGSSYAISYAPQKFVEALQGGEKPAVVLFGHWHKMDCFNYRNVWILQGGTTEDQTPFMRKKKLEAHVGGMIVELEQDKHGSITVCVPRMRRYFDRGYYNNQFNMAGDINRARV